MLKQYTARCIDSGGKQLVAITMSAENDADAKTQMADALANNPFEGVGTWTLERVDVVEVAV